MERGFGMRSAWALRAIVVFALSGAALSAPAATAADRAAVDYELAHTVALGAPGSQDYLTFDPTSSRLFMSHATKVVVIDAKTHAIVGTIGPFHDTHGIALVTALGKGYADSGDDGVVKVFNLSDLKITQTIKVSPDADGMAFDPHTGLVLVVAGDAHNLTTIDPAHDAVAKVIDLGGKPEFLAIDGAGKAYVNLMDLNKIAKVDIASGKVEATWPLVNCTTPKGLAYDAKTHRLFSGCASGRMAVVDAADGRAVANLPIGVGSDGIAVDAQRGLAFSSNGEGTLTVVKHEDGDAYSVVRTIPSFFGGRTMTLDPARGTLFVAYDTLKREPVKKGEPPAIRFGFEGTGLAIFEPRF
jgi:DNA-binding beta-propeller fold protein YncE